MTMRPATSALLWTFCIAPTVSRKLVTVDDEVKTRNIDVDTNDEFGQVAAGSFHDPFDAETLPHVEAGDVNLAAVLNGATALAWAFERLLREPAALARVKNYVDTGAFLAVQAAGAEVLKQAERLAAGYTAQFKERRDAIRFTLRLCCLRAVRAEPAGANRERRTEQGQHCRLGNAADRIDDGVARGVAVAAASRNGGGSR